ncbi:PAN domain protein [Teladorsagia circumcincta]|uniref:PAN domain protein n=1 Tax=Teladorsagia circumcincta TaxID=45464 RepID=A0A2G9U3J8_TELCI|nr:PAN domain protein [Teladorsagia circumcincta]
MLRAALLLALSSTALAVFECSNQETTAFVRIARARLDGTPVVVSTAGTSQLTANPSANNFYYEKTCLPGVSAHEACTYRSFSFERMRKTVLEGFVRKSVQKCLDSLNTFCRSVEFNPTEKNCIVSDEDTFSRADQQGQVVGKDYYEPICVAADLSSSTCRQQAAFERFIGSSIEGEIVASAQGVTIADCISLCFQNLNCKSINFDRTGSTCFIYAVGRSDANVKANPAMDYYEFNCESQFGGMALCTNEGIRFIVNTKEPYTGAIYAAERFSTCSQDGRMEALVVVSLDGVLPHQSNCLDSGTNELFMSHGRKKRSAQPTEGQSEETLSAIIRVLAKGEEEELQASNRTLLR